MENLIGCYGSRGWEDFNTYPTLPDNPTEKSALHCMQSMGQSVIMNECVDFFWSFHTQIESTSENVFCSALSTLVPVASSYRFA
jgi:hypothetical protein